MYAVERDAIKRQIQIAEIIRATIIYDRAAHACDLICIFFSLDFYRDNATLSCFATIRAKTSIGRYRFLSREIKKNYIIYISSLCCVFFLFLLYIATRRTLSNRRAIWEWLLTGITREFPGREFPLLCCTDSILLYTPLKSISFSAPRIYILLARG